MMMSGRHGKFWLPATQPCFFREYDQGQAPVVEGKDKEYANGGAEILYCRQCNEPVTSKEERVRVLAKHYHSFPNPEGIVFEIGCFSLAPGCARQGRATEKYSWFPPHAWCFALCRSCKTHLGWFYEAAGKSSFYGLILDRLVEGSD